MSYRNALEYHANGRPGKIEVAHTKPMDTQRDLSMAYTPGVADACRAIEANPDDVFKYTAKGNLVAVVTNGTAVLGLGNIGAQAGKPVMEGKANLFKKFADIDVFDIELDATTADEMVEAVIRIAPTFGGINLEDIKAPECFEVERRLQEALDIPVFHDDQHGTAIISAAAMLNAMAITERDMADARIVFSGAGAAAIACAKLYVAVGASPANIVMCDSRGAIRADRPNLSSSKALFATDRDLHNLTDALVGADAFVGLSVGGVVSAEMIGAMAPDPIIFAMANPDPEIPYEVARSARPDAIVATGRSDKPNQVNNVLGFPFIFRGALDCRARKITEEMKVAATRALAALAREDVPDAVLKAYDTDRMSFGREYIIPKPFDHRVLLYVAPAVAKAAEASGVAREPIADLEAYREQLYALVERARGLMHPLIARAKASPRQRIVFADGTNLRVLRAAQILLDEGLCTPILLGDPKAIRACADDAKLSLRGAQLRELNLEHDAHLAEQLWELRRRKGMTLEGARARLRDPSYLAALLVKDGQADGLVGGIGRPYKHTLRPALKVLGRAPGAATVSGVYAMLVGDRQLFFGDCTVNIHPNAHDLAHIAVNTAEVARRFGQTPRIAMLSYSDFGEHLDDPTVRTVTEALEHVRRQHPELEVDGEMQADTAVDHAKMASFPFTTLSGPANVLVFPDLTSGNISYKLLVKLTGAEAVGPLLVGAGAPINVIPVGATVNEIVNATVYTVIQALDRQRAG